MSTLGGYELHRSIGEGRLTEVHLARDANGRIVVIKRFAEGRVAGPEAIEAALAAARKSMQIDHAGFARVLTVSDGPPHFIATEYVHGETVGAILEKWRGAPVSVGIAARIVADAALSLHHAHELRDERNRSLGLVHGALGPDNLLVSYEGQVKITDVGWTGRTVDARRVGGAQAVGRTMAPEQAIGARVDRRADIFALGVILWELLTGDRLFEASTAADLVTKITIDEIPSPRDRNPSVPERLASIVTQALTRSLVRRMPTAAALHRELQAFLKESGEAADVAGYMQSTFVEERGRREALRAEIGSAAEIEEIEVSEVLPIAEMTTQPVIRLEPSPTILVDPSLYEEPRSKPAPPPPAPGQPAGPGAPPPPPRPPEAAPHASSGGSAAAPPWAPAPIAPPASLPRSAPAVPPPPPVAARMGPVPAPPPGSVAEASVWETASVPEAPPVAEGATAPSAWDAAQGQEQASRLDLADDVSFKRSRTGLVVFVALIVLGAATAWFVFRGDRADTRGEPAAQATGSILVRSDPDGAAISIDGRDTGKRTPARIDGLSLDAPHRVELTLGGRIPWAERITALAEGRSVHAMLAPDTPEYRERGGATEIDSAVAAPPSPAAPPGRRVTSGGAAPASTPPAGDAEHAEAAATDTGFLTVQTGVRALVTFDGRPLGRAPLYKVRVPAGSHQVRVQFEGAESTSWRDARVQIRPGWEFTLRVSMDE